MKCEQAIGVQPLSAWDTTTVPYIVTCPHEAERNARHCWRHTPPSQPTLQGQPNTERKAA